MACCGTSLQHLIGALDSSATKISPSCSPAASSCPTYRTPEITLLTVDLLPHRAFSTVIPNCRHSCGAKIDLHPCAIGSGKQILDCDSALLSRHGRRPCPTPLAGIGYKNLRLGYFSFSQVDSVWFSRNSTPWRQSTSLQGLMLKKINRSWT